MRRKVETSSLDDAERFSARLLAALDSPAPAVGLGREHLLAGAGIT